MERAVATPQMLGLDDQQSATRGDACAFAIASESEREAIVIRDARSSRSLSRKSHDDGG